MQYRLALDQLKAGLRDVVFPYGTWRIHCELGFPCAPRPAPEDLGSQAEDLNVGRLSLGSNAKAVRASGCLVT